MIFSASIIFILFVLINCSNLNDRRILFVISWLGREFVELLIFPIASSSPMIKERGQKIHAGKFYLIVNDTVQENRVHVTLLGKSIRWVVIEVREEVDHATVTLVRTRDTYEGLYCALWALTPTRVESWLQNIEASLIINAPVSQCTSLSPGNKRPKQVGTGEIQYIISYDCMSFVILEELSWLHSKEIKFHGILEELSPNILCLSFYDGSSF